MNAIERFKTRKNFAPEVSFEYPPADARKDEEYFVLTLTRLSPIEEREFRQRSVEVLTKRQYDVEWCDLVSRLLVNHFKACSVNGVAWTQTTFTEFLVELRFGELMNLSTLYMVALSEDEERAAQSPL